MFKSKQDSEQRKITLPKRTVAPGPDYLEFIIKQAFQYRGQDVEVVWTNRMATKQFRLTARAERGSSQANWQLWEETGRDNQMMWSHDTIDLELIESMISMIDTGTQDQLPVQPENSSPSSPYRNPFSASYQGITPAGNNSLSKSLTRMRPIGQTTSSYNLSPVQTGSSHDLDPVRTGNTEPSQTISTEALAQVPLSADAPSLVVKQIITEGLTKLAGNRQIMPVYVISDMAVSGTLEQSGMKNSRFIELMSTGRVTGKLELATQDLRAEIFFVDGELHSAFAANNHGNEAMTELLIWTPGSFRFTVGERSPVRNVTIPLYELESNSREVHDQLAHLEKAGLAPKALITKTHQSIGDSELRLMLMKSMNADIDAQISLYRELSRKFTLTQFLAKRSMTKSIWVPILFNYFTCGLIEFKAPLSTNDEQLDFLGDAKASVQLLKSTFLRKETGVLNFPAFLFFLQYEYLRFQSYDWPLTLVIFEMNKQSTQAIGGLDLINQQETFTALQRIENIKRPLDQLGHFEAIDFGLLLPNTDASTANQIANQIEEVLRAEPLSGELEDKFLKLSFGIATIPEHCEDLQNLILNAKKALSQAKGGQYPIVIAPRETQSF